MRHKMKIYTLLIGCLIGMLLLSGCKKKEAEDVITLRVANWEEYIDEGDWDEEDAIELSDGSKIQGVNSLVDDFETWYEKTYHKKVKVEYSTFGTNEDLYNQLTIGDTFDLVCPSEYMIMKLMSENQVKAFSRDFYDTSKEENYYIKGVSPYIKKVFREQEINGDSIFQYAAGYMWGTLGFVYNPKIISEEEVSDWNVLRNKKYSKQITTKDSIRDCFFAGVSMVHQEELEKATLDEKAKILNDTSKETVSKVETVLSDMKDNVYSFETDSGKADLVTGKVAANLQWSGDGAYSISQAEEDGVELCYAVPTSSTNIWFDGWCMLKNGIGNDSEKQQAAEAFVNFLSRPDNAVRNMEYIGYTSAISGGDDGTIFDYIKTSYGEEHGSETYSLGYFFSGDYDDDHYKIQTSKKQTRGELFSRCPTKDVIDRAVVMEYFPKEADKRIRQMWTNIRCFRLGE